MFVGRSRRRLLPAFLQMEKAHPLNEWGRDCVCRLHHVAVPDELTHPASSSSLSTVRAAGAEARPPHSEPRMMLFKLVLDKAAAEFFDVHSGGLLESEAATLCTAIHIASAVPPSVRATMRA